MKQNQSFAHGSKTASLSRTNTITRISADQNPASHSTNQKPLKSSDPSISNKKTTNKCAPARYDRSPQHRRRSPQIFASIFYVIEDERRSTHSERSTQIAAIPSDGPLFGGWLLTATPKRWPGYVSHKVRHISLL